MGRPSYVAMVVVVVGAFHRNPRLEFPVMHTMNITQCIIVAVLLGLPLGVVVAQEADHWRDQREKLEREYDELAEEQAEGLEDAAHLADITDADLAEAERYVSGAREDLKDQVVLENTLGTIWNGVTSWAPWVAGATLLGGAAYKGGPPLVRAGMEKMASLASHFSGPRVGDRVDHYEPRKPRDRRPSALASGEHSA